MSKKSDTQVILEEIEEALLLLTDLPGGDAALSRLAIAASSYIEAHPEARSTLLEMIFIRIWAIEGEMDDWR